METAQTTQKTTQTATMQTIASRGVPVSEDLLRRVRLLAQKKLGQNKLAWEKKEDLLDMVEEYEAACELSRGQDAGRSAHWTDKARMLEARLTTHLDTLDGGRLKT